MRRRVLNRKQRAALFLEHNGTCHICGGRIGPETWEVEHIIPLALGGNDEPSNMAPAHLKCHRAKTRKDVADIAKSVRVEARHRGFKPPSRTPLPFGKGSPLKRKLNGQIVPRT